MGWDFPKKEITRPESCNLSLLQNLRTATQVKNARLFQARNLYWARVHAGLEDETLAEFLGRVPKIPEYLLNSALQSFYDHIVLVDQRGVDVEGALGLFEIQFSALQSHMEIWNTYQDVREMYWVVCQTKRHKGLRMCHAEKKFVEGEIGGNFLELSFLYYQDPGVLKGSLDCLGSNDESWYSGERYRCISLCHDVQDRPMLRSIDNYGQDNRCAVWTRHVPFCERGYLRGSFSRWSLSA